MLFNLNYIDPAFSIGPLSIKWYGIIGGRNPYWLFHSSRKLEICWFT